MSVTFALHQSEVHAVREMNFTLSQGETLAVVGEVGLGQEPGVPRHHGPAGQERHGQRAAP